MVMAVMIIGAFIWFKPYQNNGAIIHDVTVYYSYLPAAFIYEDMSMDFIRDLPKNEPRDGVWVNEDESGNFHLKMTCGVAYFLAPGFFLSHLWAQNSTEYAANGYSFPYQAGVALTTLLIGLLTMMLWVFRLSKRFNWKVVALTVACVFLGSNWLYYTTGVSGLSHPFTFFLVSLMVFQTPKLGRGRYTDWLWMGVLVAWIILIRPTNAILALYPVVYWILAVRRSRSAWKAGVSCFIISAVMGFLVVLPQLLYWREVTGSWVFYSYSGEGFFWFEPMIGKGLWGFRSGWLVYSPVWILAIIGWFWMKGAHRWSSLAVFIPFVYVVFSWWCWWYGGSFGSRVMLDFGPLLVLPMAVFWVKVLGWVRTKAGRIGITVSSWFLALMFVGLNAFQTWQYTIGMIHWDAMTKEAYQAIFLKTKVPEGFGEMLEEADYEEARNGVR
jgi:hypothetical protein